MNLDILIPALSITVALIAIVTAFIGVRRARRQFNSHLLEAQRVIYLLEESFKRGEGAPEALHSTVAFPPVDGPKTKSDVNIIRRSFAEALDSLNQSIESSHQNRNRHIDLHIDVPFLQNLHHQLMPANTEEAGNLRASEIRIAGSAQELPNADQVPELLSDLCQEWNSLANKLPKQKRRTKPGKIPTAKGVFEAGPPFCLRL